MLPRPWQTASLHARLTRCIAFSSFGPTNFTIRHTTFGGSSSCNRVPMISMTFAEEWLQKDTLESSGVAFLKREWQICTCPVQSDPNCRMTSPEQGSGNSISGSRESRLHDIEPCSSTGLFCGVAPHTSCFKPVASMPLPQIPSVTTLLLSSANPNPPFWAI